VSPRRPLPMRRRIRPIRGGILVLLAAWAGGLASGLARPDGEDARTSPAAPLPNIARADSQPRESFVGSEAAHRLSRRLREPLDSAGPPSILVFPIVIERRTDTKSASDLARWLSRVLGVRCAVGAAWGPADADACRAAPAQRRTTPVDADYTLLVEYRLRPAHWEQGVVIFTLCEAGGELVFAEIQDASQPLFRRMAPVAADDAGMLVVRRIQQGLAACDPAGAAGTPPAPSAPGLAQFFLKP
jgi:hypothetical protein